MAKLIGTAGHVDHGKTTLIRALTGIDADRLPEERKRGMTIDVGFAYIDFPKVGRVSIVDVPGHERFIKNMLVGALGIDVALLSVAADDGVMPQTREHLQILELLPVERLVVALTRSDLADDETRALCKLDVEQLIGTTRFVSSPICFVSALTGEGLPDLRVALADALSQERADEAGPWYMPIDRVFSVKGYGTVVTGTVARGELREGDAAMIFPGKTPTRIRKIEWHDQPQPSSERGRRTALNLGGIKAERVHRGMSIGADGALFETIVVDLTMQWVAEPKHGSRVRLAIGADDAVGKLFLNAHDSAFAQVRLDRPVAAATEQPVILRAYSPPVLLGGGRVRLPLARPVRRSERPEQAASSADALSIVSLVASAASGLENEELCRRLGRTAQSLGDELEVLKSRGELIGFAGLWFTRETFELATARLLQALLELHGDMPMKSMVPRERAIEKSKLSWIGKPLDRILAHLAGQSRIRLDGTLIAHSDFRVQLNARQRELLDRAIEALLSFGVNPPGERGLAEALGVPVQAVSEIIRLGLETQALTRIAEGYVLPQPTLESVKVQIVELAKEGPFTSSRFRDALQTSRKFAIPLLEYFDSIRFTRRAGDMRVLEARD